MVTQANPRASIKIGVPEFNSQALRAEVTMLAVVAKRIAASSGDLLNPGLDATGLLIPPGS